MKRFLWGWVLLGLPLGVGGQAKADYIFTTIEPPGSFAAFANGINDSGQIVGYYDGHGFLLSGGNYTRLDVPGSYPGSTTANEINNAGQIVGGYYDGNDPRQTHGFLLSGGRYTTVGLPGAMLTSAYGINDAGQIVGFYGNIHGFLLTGGSYTTIGVPGSLNATSANGINNHGQIVGSYGDFNSSHGFLLSGDSDTTIDVPGSPSTSANDINNAGQIVGTYYVGPIAHGFLLSDGTYTTIDVPASTFTFAGGINDAGQIVGAYYDARGHVHGFLATPVSEPSTLLLLAMSTVGLIGRARRRKVSSTSAGNVPADRRPSPASIASMSCTATRWLARTAILFAAIPQLPLRDRARQPNSIQLSLVSGLRCTSRDAAVMRSGARQKATW